MEILTECELRFVIDGLIHDTKIFKATHTISSFYHYSKSMQIYHFSLNWIPLVRETQLSSIDYITISDAWIIWNVWFEK